MDPPSTPPNRPFLPDAETPGSATAAQRLAFGRRSLGSRVSTACERCRRRKIRCDGYMPACRPCQRAKTECVFVSGASPRPIVSSAAGTDGGLAEAQLRIRQLEHELARQQSASTRVDGDQPSDHRTHSALYQQGRVAQLSSSHSAIDFHQEPPARPVPDNSTSNEPAHSDERVADAEQPILAHEIGLVSLTPGSEARYIGPSSGFFFARKIMGSLNNNNNQAKDSSHRKLAQIRNSLESAVRKDVDMSSPTPLPSSADLCKQLSAHYFRTIHVELPFMHEQQHMSTIDAVYSAPDSPPLATFQINMVLALAATDLSKRLKVSVNPVGYFTNAQRLLENFSTEGSLKGLQCLLLLVVYAMHQPNTGLNAWYLHYETIASVLDLGLQRDVSRLALPLKEQEMRTRIFWVVYSLDRRLATMTGRPIGLRDEACELRLPLPASDGQLDTVSSADGLSSNRVTHLTWAVHLFRLAQINSEIKYVLHSISKESGHFSFSPVHNVLEWQENMTRRLDAWAAEIRAIPEEEEGDDTADGASRRLMWLQRYREILILLQWPSPAIRVPCRITMLSCYSNALASLSLLIDLYQSEQLVYSTTAIHSVFVAALTMLYCLSTNPDIARTVPRPHQDVDKLYQSMNILTSLGEYWVECRRARDGLVQVARPIIEQFLQQAGSQSLDGVTHAGSTTPMNNTVTTDTTTDTTRSIPQSHDHTDPAMGSLVFDDFLPAMDAFMNPDFFMAQFEGLGGLQDPTNDDFVDPLLNSP